MKKLSEENSINAQPNNTDEIIEDIMTRVKKLETK